MPSTLNTTVPVAHFAYRLRNDQIREFVVVGACDPHQRVETPAPDGSIQAWDRREEGDLLVFRPPDGYRPDVDQGVMWRYDDRLQRGEPMPRNLLERFALGNRVSILV